MWGCDELTAKCVRKMWVRSAVLGLKPGWEQGCDHRHTRGDPEPFGVARAFTAQNEPLGINTRSLGRFMVYLFVQLPADPVVRES